jgi:hypothetical protein
MSDGRESNGRFANGNPGGPGRPRRTIEREYLAVLGDSVSLDDWPAIVHRAVERAMCGIPNARDWLTGYLLGAEPPKLLDLAVSDARGRTVNDTFPTKA